jgi:hypothetical protein
VKHVVAIVGSRCDRAPLNELPRQYLVLQKVGESRDQALSSQEQEVVADLLASITVVRHLDSVALYYFLILWNFQMVIFFNFFNI